MWNGLDMDVIDIEIRLIWSLEKQSHNANTQIVALLNALLIHSYAVLKCICHTVLLSKL